MKPVFHLWTKKAKSSQSSDTHTHASEKPKKFKQTLSARKLDLVGVQVRWEGGGT
jgi:hypothetical protein